MDQGVEMKLFKRLLKMLYICEKCHGPAQIYIPGTPYSLFRCPCNRELMAKNYEWSGDGLI